MSAFSPEAKPAVGARRHRSKLLETGGAGFVSFKPGQELVIGNASAI
jgi:hypothetical protein